MRGIYPLFVVLQYSTILNTMANKFLDWVDRVGLPVSGLIAVWGAIIVAALATVRILFKF